MKNKMLQILIFFFSLAEIYRIVSQKQLPDGPGGAGQKPGSSTGISLGPSDPENNSSKKPCCNN